MDNIAGIETRIAVHDEQIKTLFNCVGEIKKTNWWIFTVCFVTLIGIAFNIAISYAQLSIRENVTQAPYSHKYPIP